MTLDLFDFVLQIDTFTNNYAIRHSFFGDGQAYAGWDCRTRLARIILRCERGQENICFPCSADHELD